GGGLDGGVWARAGGGGHRGGAGPGGPPPPAAAAWIEGFVGGGSGGGMLLLHDERLLALVDAWLTGVPAESFRDVLPLLRRTFSAYESGVRRGLGELVRRGPEARGSVTTAGAGIPGFAAGLDTGRADAVLPVVRLLLGRYEAGEDHAGRADAGQGRGSRADAGEDRAGRGDAAGCGEAVVAARGGGAQGRARRMGEAVCAAGVGTGTESGRGGAGPGAGEDDLVGVDG
ncbi:DUF5682 family protein, partial [Streptomyces olivaceus]|uniref:DUF5682 family protein n=1 Tax=Streptomyces olivaceus TaxID=47716 RepID=UPI00364982A4